VSARTFGRTAVPRLLVLAALAAAVAVANLVRTDDAAAVDPPAVGPARGAPADGLRTWDRVVGGPAADRAYAVAPLPDGGVVVAGHTRAGGVLRDDGMVVRLDASGTPVWQRVVGGFDTEQLYGIARLPDGGYLAAGHTRSAGAGESDLWLLRLDGDGRVAWQRVEGGPANDRGRTLIALPDGGAVVAGFTASRGAGGRDAWVLRVDASGSVLWQRTFGGSGDDGAFALAPAPGGDVFVAGHSQDAGDRSFRPWVARLSADGDTVWRRSYPDGPFSAATGLAPAADGGLAVVGLRAERALGGDDIRVLRLGSAGEVLWDRRLGGPGRDTAWGVVASGDGGFVLAGASASFGAGSADAWIVGLDGQGRTLWESLHGGALWDRPTALARRAGGGLLVGGYTTSRGAGFEDFWLLALDARGRLSGLDLR